MKKRLKKFLAICFAAALSVCILAPAAFAATATISSNADWSGEGTLSEDTVWTFQNGATVTFKGTFVIPDGLTLTLKGWGSIARYSTNTNALFVIQDGGKLVVEGTSADKPFTIDGKDVIANASLIVSSGALDFENAVIQNGKNRSVYAEDHAKAGQPNGQGGGITVGKTGSLTMENCIVTKNTASLNGGGIYSTGPVTAKNSEISWNRAMSAETAYSTVNAGRGGGFALAGENADGVFENVLITQNAAMYYGGGGQVSGSGSSLTMSGNTVFSHNTAVLHGAGALHLTGDAAFTMNGGSMENNFAQYCGGAIHSSYSCVLNLNSGTISNNTANGRGGGVHINTGGAVTLGEGIVISGNKVYNQPIGSSADLDATGDNWSNVKCEHYVDDFGYGGGVLIDSGTCTVAGATITDNYAEVGGGGIALTMLNMNSGGLDDLMVAKFEMTSGTVSGNNTDGNGAGVYLMSNKTQENLIKAYGEIGSEGYEEAIEIISTENRHIITGTYEDVNDILNGVPEASVSGGTISDNVAKGDGGGLYLGENTIFTISGTGDVSGNEAVDGAGVYVASGTAEIDGGTMSQNAASGNGGAVYVSGTVSMTDGSITGNKASLDGGAVYVTGGDFTMTSGSMTGNMAIGSNSAGGGAYVTGGNVVIGVKDCTGAGDNHTVSPTDKPHPVINGNSAVDSGGGIAVMGNGSITMYCGDASENNATNKGRGLNVYMEEGVFDLYAGSIGATTDPDLVIVGGKLIDHSQESVADKITLQYHHCNFSDHLLDHVDELANMLAYATKGALFNLPDGEKYWTAEEGYRFFGWTFYGSDNDASKKEVRSKDDYLPMGTPIETLDSVDGSPGDGKIMMYALWAPETSDITYVGSVISGTYAAETLSYAEGVSNPEEYDFTVGSNVVTLNAPVKAGYKLTGWYMYQDEGQNANWGYEPTYIGGTKSYAALDYTNLQFFPAQNDGTCDIEMGTTFFGDITLIAAFEPVYSDLTIVKSYPEGADYSIDENQSFVFNVAGDPDDSALDDIQMTVVVHGNSSVTIEHLPVGTYTVTEVTDWSWRYSNTSITPSDGIVKLEKPEAPQTVTFTNERNEEKWLSGDSWCRNLFKSNKVEQWAEPAVGE